jgi:integrase
MKVSVRPVSSRGQRRFVVSWRPTGEPRKRLYFTRRDEADAQAQTLRGQEARTGEVWLALGPHKRDELVLLLKETERDGFSLREAVEYYRANREVACHNLNAGQALEEFMRETGSALISRKTKAALRSNVGRFISLRQNKALRSITREEVLSWLRRDEWGPRTFNTYLISLKTFFNWCVKIKYLKEAPTASIEAIHSRRMPDLDQPPAILSLEQCERLLRVTWETDPGLITYVAVGLFAGLRPEREAGSLVWQDIQDGLICVRGLHAKDRQRRNVEIHPTLKAWLDLGGDLPPVNLRRRFERVREAAGLIRVDRAESKVIRDPSGRVIRRERHKVAGQFAKRILNTGWSQDCIRHTFASHYLPVHGAEKTIAQMGHGDYNTLFSHYRALVTPQQANAFWQLTPHKVLPRVESVAA